jgi:hypothetical protein
MTGPELHETPDGRALAVHVSPEGDLREYLYGEFDDFEDDCEDVCGSCGGHDGEYDDCEFASLGCYEPGPGGPGVHGCPRITGTF